MNQTWENGKKLISGLALARFDPKLILKNFFHEFYLY